MHPLHQSLQWPFQANTVTIPFFQMRKLELREEMHRLKVMFTQIVSRGTGIKTGRIFISGHFDKHLLFSQTIRARGDLSSHLLQISYCIDGTTENQKHETICCKKPNQWTTVISALASQQAAVFMDWAGLQLWEVQGVFLTMASFFQGSSFILAPKHHFLYHFPGHPLWHMHRFSYVIHFFHMVGIHPGKVQISPRMLNSNSKKWKAVSEGQNSHPT